MKRLLLLLLALLPVLFLTACMGAGGQPGMFDFIAKPIGQFLMIIYEAVGNYGIAILILAIVVKIVLLPFQMKSKKGQMRQARLQPKIAELQKKHGTNKAKINEEMAKLYKEEGVNPASGCLWSFLPLPIMFALFYVIRQPLTLMMGVASDALQEGGKIFQKLSDMNFQQTLSDVYVEIEQAQFITANFAEFSRLGIENLREISFYLFPYLNLGAQPQYTFLWSTDWGNKDVWLPGLLLFIIPLISGGSQFVSSAIMRKVTPTATPDGAGKSMQSMMMLMPLMSIVFGFMFPAALGFYWTIGTVLQIGQDIFLTKRYTKILDAEDEERNKQRKKKEAEIEAKRLESERKKADGVVEKNPNVSKKKKQKSEKQSQLEKTAEWEKKNAPPADEKNEPSRVGNRRYARGRAYDPDRYGASAAAAAGSESPEETDDADKPEKKKKPKSGDKRKNTEVAESEMQDPEEGGGSETESGPQSEDVDPDSGDERADGGDEAETEPESEDLDAEEDGEEDDDASGSDDDPDDASGGDDDPDDTSTVKFDTKRFDDDGKD